MDKLKAFLTQKLNKNSFKDVNVRRAIKLTLCGAMLIALMLQAFGCFFAPMIAYATEDESIVGTWVFNEELTSYYPTSVTFEDGVCDSYFYTSTSSVGVLPVYMLSYVHSNSGSGVSFFGGTSSNKYSKVLYYDVNDDSSTNPVKLDGPQILREYINGKWSYGYTSKNSENGLLLRTIVFNENYDNSEFLTWLKANATKVFEEVYDFTGETRIFNDELTLFNTSDATWTEAFSFNFEVLGVGTADHITLQRTSQNNYTMSYAFDFEGSGGLTMIYRDSPPYDNGEAEWLGGKVNRKVIKFLSNPDYPEFQQWLLDNTTIFDNVNVAYELGQQSGYNNGYEEGFANSLIGDSLSGPINALSQITLIEIQGTAITLGGVVMTAIALCLVLAFLKLYAGG